MKKYNVGDVVLLNGDSYTRYTVIGIRTSKRNTDFDPDYVLVPSNILSPSVKYVYESTIKERLDVIVESYALNESLYNAIVDNVDAHCRQRVIESGHTLSFILIDFDELMEVYRKL